MLRPIRGSRMPTSPRLLYVGNLREGGNGLDWMSIIGGSGIAVTGFDRFPYVMAGSRVERSVSSRFSIGRAVSRFNRDLLTAARATDYDAVFVEKGTWLYPETLHALKSGARAGLAIHFTPDAQFLENRSRHFFRGLAQYDLSVTTKEFELESYRAGGARDLLLILQGHGRRLSPRRPQDVPAQLRSEIAFIGHCQRHYAARLATLARTLPVAIWGPNWMRHARRHAWARSCVRGDGLFGPGYAQALSGAKIALGLLSKRIPETTTTRTFEIPACGTMMLAERTAPHEALFAEGKEAEFFASDEELVDKARFYLGNDAARERIAAAGLARSRSCGYSAEQQFRRIVDWLKGRLA